MIWSKNKRCHLDQIPNRSFFLNSIPSENRTTSPPLASIITETRPYSSVFWIKYLDSRIVGRAALCEEAEGWV